MRKNELNLFFPMKFINLFYSWEEEENKIENLRGRRRAINERENERLERPVSRFYFFPPVDGSLNYAKKRWA